MVFLSKELKVDFPYIGPEVKPYDFKGQSKLVTTGSGINHITCYVCCCPFVGVLEMPDLLPDTPFWEPDLDGVFHPGRRAAKGTDGPQILDQKIIELLCLEVSDDIDLNVACMQLSVQDFSHAFQSQGLNILWCRISQPPTGGGITSQTAPDIEICMSPLALVWQTCLCFVKSTLPHALIFDYVGKALSAEW